MRKLRICDGKVLFVESLRVDGNMRSFSEDEDKKVISNQKKAAKECETTGDKTARVLTTYDRGTYLEYFEVNEDNLADFCILKPESELKAADGLVTKSKDIALLLPLADCLGVVLYDVRQEILALVHSGRQNLEEDGTYKFVNFLKDKMSCRPEDLKVYLSPHAQNFEIYKLDNAKLAEAAREQLMRAGVLEENIEASDVDTVTNEEYPSNSAGDKIERFAICVKMI